MTETGTHAEAYPLPQEGDECSILSALGYHAKEEDHAALQEYVRDAGKLGKLTIPAHGTEPLELVCDRTEGKGWYRLQVTG
jgi:hypothetical protein